MRITTVKSKDIIRIYPKGEESFDYKKISSDIAYNKDRDCYECGFENYRKVILSLPNSKFSDSFLKKLSRLERDEVDKLYRKPLRVKHFNIKLRRFQKTGINFSIDKLLQEHASVIISDEMGLGKTIEALGCALILKDLKKIKHVLIVCPNSAKKEWERMIRAFTNESYMILENSSCLGCRVFFTVTNYDQIRVLGGKLNSEYYDLLVVDEFHNIKNKYAKRTRALTRFKPSYKIFLSGTPILNRTEELWTILNYISPRDYPNHNKFIKKYCVIRKIKVPIIRRGRFIYSKYIDKIVGAKNVLELRMNLKDYMIRRRKEEV